jgi:hypothetical protein
MDSTRSVVRAVCYWPPCGGLGTAGLCCYAKIQSHRPVTLPAPTGPDRVGRMAYDWTDPTRIHPFAPGGHTHRELSVVVWYPAPSAPTTSYWLPGWAQALGDGGPIDSATRTLPARIVPHAVRDVTRNVPAGDRRVWTVAGAEHVDFSDRAVYFTLFGRQIGSLGPIDGARAVAITEAYVRAFFDPYVRHLPAPLLAGPAAAYPEVTQQR